MNNWGQSTGFGTANHQLQSSGLSDNKLATSGGLFGASSTNTSATAGLFGSTASNSTSANTGGLFGNSGGLVKRSGNELGSVGSTSAANTGGGLFGNLQSQNTSTVGLFGSNSLKRLASAAASLGGLFGNIASTTTGTSNGLFGGLATKPTPGGLFGGSPSNLTAPASGGLMGVGSSSTSSAPSQGLFGNLASKPTLGGLFGNPGTTASLGGLFGTLNNLSSSGAAPKIDISSNPYNNAVMSSIARGDQLMPQSLTHHLYPDAGKELPRSRKFSYLDKTGARQVLSLLGSTIRAVKEKALSSVNPFQGLFSVPARRDAHPRSPAGPVSVPVSRPSTATSNTPILLLRLRMALGNMGLLKRLVIKLKPVKFHLINADKVLAAKKQRLVAVTDIEIDSDTEDEDIDDRIDGTTRERAKSRVVFHGSLAPSEQSVPHSTSGNALSVVANPPNPLGYFSHPPLAQILAHPDAVENLVIGRDGHGQIAWLVPVNMRELAERYPTPAALGEALFDGIVKCAGKVVMVYVTEPSEKPLPGCGLNVPAVLTVPAPLQPGCLVTEFIDRLKRLPGQEFVTYDPRLSMYTFKVKHFSVWGVVDEDTPVEIAEAKRVQDEAELGHGSDVHISRTTLAAAAATSDYDTLTKYHDIYSQPQYFHDGQHHRLGLATRGVPGGWVREEELAPLTAKRSLIAQQVAQRINDYLPDVDMEDESVDDDEGGQDLRDMLTSIPRSAINDVIMEKAYEPELAAPEVQFRLLEAVADIPTSLTWLVQLELANDFNSALVPTYNVSSIDDVDKGLFGGMPPRQANEPNPNFVSTKDPNMLVAHSGEPDVILIVARLSPHLRTFSRENKYPKTEVNVHFSQLAVTPGLKASCKVHLQLAAALFDEVTHETEGLSAEVRHHVANETRRLRLHLWLISYNRRWVKEAQASKRNDHPEHDDLHVAYITMCSGNLLGAIKTVPEGFPHLKVAMTMADANDEAARDLAGAQLDQWAESGALAHVPDLVVAIYRLIANDWLEIGSLPWSMQLATKFVYGSQLVPLADLLDEIDLLQNQVAALMQAYAATTTDKPVDTLSLEPLLAWLVGLLVGSKGAADDAAKLVGDSLVDAHPWEAVLVYLTISDDIDARDAIRRAVIGATGSGTSWDTLMVPQELIFEAHAADAAANDDHWSQCHYLVKARLYGPAHEVIKNYLGPEFVTSGTRGSDLAALIGQFPRNGQILLDWNIGGGIYAHYIDLLSGQADAITPLLENLPFMTPPDSFDGKVAVHIMARRLGDAATTRGEKPAAIFKLPLSDVDRNYFRLRIQK